MVGLFKTKEKTKRRHATDDVWEERHAADEVREERCAADHGTRGEVCSRWQYEVCAADHGTGGERCSRWWQYESVQILKLSKPIQD